VRQLHWVRRLWLFHSEVRIHSNVGDSNVYHDGAASMAETRPRGHGGATTVRMGYPARRDGRSAWSRNRPARATASPAFVKRLPSRQSWFRGRQLVASLHQLHDERHGSIGLQVVLIDHRHDGESAERNRIFIVPDDASSDSLIMALCWTVCSGSTWLAWVTIVTTQADVGSRRW